MTTRNHRALRRTACFCLSLAALIGSGAAAQDVTSFTRTTDPLTQSQQQALQQFVDGGIRGLESDSAEAVVAARQRMIEPLTKSGTSPVFRDAFGKLFIKQVEGLDSGKSLATFNYANIYQVLAFVRTGDSNEFLASCLEPRLGSEGDSPQSQGRKLSAASMLALSIQTTNPNVIRPRQFNSIIRSILNGAESTSSWALLQREFESLDSIGSNTDVKDDIRQSAVENQMKILQSTLAKIAEGRDLGLVQAISPMILRMRSQYIRLDGAIRKTFNSDAQATLALVLSTGMNSWDTLHGDQKLAEIYGKSIEQATVLMRLLKGGGGTSTSPAEAWRNGDQTAYAQAVKSWL